MNGPAAAEKTAASVPVSKDPVLALVLSVLAPGAGHLYAGRLRRGAIWFLAANLCFVTGLWLAGPIIFQWSGASSMPSGVPKPYLLLLLPIPELFNLSATLLAAMKFLSPSVAAADASSLAAVVGSTLSAASGILALLCMADAWTIAKGEIAPSGKSATRACLLSWVLPGLGHYYLGKTFHARVFFSAILGLFLVGIFLSDGLVTSREKYFYYWAGQALVGAPTVIASWVGQGLRAERFLPYQDLGLLFVTSAGLLNVLVMLSAHATARGEKN